MKLLPIDEINLLCENIRKHPKQIEKDDLIDMILGVLIMCYKNGTDDGNEMIDTDIANDFGLMEDSINKEYEGKTWEDRVTEYYNENDGESIARVIDTEAHRNYNQGIYDLAEQSGEKVTKTWKTMGDEKVRETHFFLQDVQADEKGYFYTFDGDRARFPGDFASASNNVNCRCYLSIEKE